MTIGSGKSVDDLEAQAAAWAAKLDATPDQSPPGLREWCEQSPRHAGALLRAQATLALFDPAIHAAEPPVDTPVHTPVAVADRLPVWKRWALAGGGAGVLAASVATFLLLHTPVEEYQTQIGELRSVALSDGSSVSIDAKSRIEIAYTAHSRDVRLLSGKALFHAEHNPQRPFRVLVGPLVITDIGTIFQVSDDGPARGVDVLVTQGAVQVASPAGGTGLTAGEHARFFPDISGAAPAKVQHIASADLDRMLAWRDGRLELDGETLDSAVADINRHSRLQLRIATPALGRESLYGSFRIDDAAGFARAAALSLGTDIHSDSDGIVIGTQKNRRGS